MEYYQADVYENVRFNAFIPNGGNLKYEAGEFIGKPFKDLREIDFDDLLGNVVAVADKNGTANIVPYVNYQAAQAQAQFTTTNIKADGKKIYNNFTK